MVSDVTEARRLEAELRHAALYDNLTGLPNRTLLMDRLKHALKRDGASTAVLFVDIDHFKQVNDVRGHDVGDEVLRRVAARLGTIVRPSDTVARFGGDEFVVVCEDTDLHEADGIARQVLSASARPLKLASGAINVSASIGIAASTTGSAETLVRDADTAMYAAKLIGRGHIQHFDSKLAARTEERRELAQGFEHALTQDELTMHFQPIVDLRSGRVEGMEALARWCSEGANVSPDRFVGVAESSGLAHQLDRWALRHALGWAGRLRVAGTVHETSYVAINISAVNLNNPQLEDDLHLWTQTANLSNDTVQLEITESGIMVDPVASAALLHRLREAGFQIAIDDFGTGHSSLAYLRNLPVTTLKIDRTFVAEITHDSNARAIAASIIDLANAIGLAVTAEGVETPQQAALLRDLGCSAAQGWLWSEAVAPSEMQRAQTMTRTYEVTPR
jgi:diguanylate cyclase (GGDEF)-like protein